MNADYIVTGFTTHARYLLPLRHEDQSQHGDAQQNPEDDPDHDRREQTCWRENARFEQNLVTEQEISTKSGQKAGDLNQISSENQFSVFLCKNRNLKSGLFLDPPVIYTFFLAISLSFSPLASLLRFYSSHSITLPSFILYFLFLILLPVNKPLTHTSSHHLSCSDTSPPSLFYFPLPFFLPPSLSLPSSLQCLLQAKMVPPSFPPSPLPSSLSPSFTLSHSGRNTHCKERWCRRAAP